MAEQRALGRNHGKAAAPVLTGEPVLLGRKQRKEQYIGLNPTFMQPGAMAATLLEAGLQNRAPDFAE
jgi:hypothetical protein